jgi:hypothetical protein
MCAALQAWFDCATPGFPKLCPLQSRRCLGDNSCGLTSAFHPLSPAATDLALYSPGRGSFVELAGPVQSAQDQIPALPLLTV